MHKTKAFYNMWGNEDYDSMEILIDCFLPSGIIVQLNVSKEASIHSIKQELWSKAKNYPLFETLKSSDNYYFMSIDEKAKKIEINDETRRLCDVRPFQPMLKLVQNKQAVGVNKDERLIKAQISIVIGKGLTELEMLKDAEVVDFRKKMGHLCENIMKIKSTQNWLELAMCYYPPDLASSPNLSTFHYKWLEGSKFLIISVRMEAKMEVISKFKVNHTILPSEIICLVFEKQSKIIGVQSNQQHQQQTNNINNNNNNFILKILGFQKYLLGEYPLSQFMHIRECITKGLIPELILVNKESLRVPNSTISPSLVTQASLRQEQELTKNSEISESSISIYSLKEYYSFRIISLANLNHQDYSNVSLRTCIYHGGENLCSIESTREIPVYNSFVFLDERIQFDLEFQNIPRMARLCFHLFSFVEGRKQTTKKGGTTVGAAGGSGVAGGGGSIGGVAGEEVVVKRPINRKKDIISLGWVNIPLFDYKGMLQSGEHSLPMWPVTNDDVLNDELLNPIGMVETNSENDNSIFLKLELSCNQNQPISFPQFEEVLEVVADDMKKSCKNLDESKMSLQDFVMDPRKVTKEHLEVLHKMIDRDPLHIMCEQEKEMIWNLRHECRQYFPQSLPWLLKCVKWNNYIIVANMQALLQIWNDLNPKEALELLDFQYADQNVRKFAVNCLSKMTDIELCQYLLQLVQVLKYEPYLECDLIGFLLERSLNNKRVGHNLFWLLKSEMHVPSVSVRFALFLEAYCRGSLHYLTELTKEVEAISNLRQLNEHIKIKCSGFSFDKLKEEMHKGLDKKYKQTLSLLCCPLYPEIRMKSLMVNKCKVMDSKMKPIWLVWDNEDNFGKDMLLMYKKGDDLRQDMLTLQVLKIMNFLWQSKGIDLRMNVYSCLSTGWKEGLIEVVTEAQTLANIQLEFSNATLSAFNKTCIYEWLKKQNPDPNCFEKALEEFLYSCAGYSVATFVLGVADRHSDNIMIRKNGQLFHIDFGHILGNFKSKFGYKREKTSFVLTTDIVYAIKKGDIKNDNNFKKFQHLCETAFLILREDSKFLITLFMMMMNTGIPEVSSTKDIEYLKESLAPHKTDKEAIAQFRAKFTDALKNSYKTSINMMCHNLRVKKSQPQKETIQEVTAQ